MDQQSTSKLPPLPEDTLEETDPRFQIFSRRAFVSTPNNPSPLQQESPVVTIKEKDYNINSNGEEVHKCIEKVERIAQIEGETDEDFAMQMAFLATDPRISDAIEAMPVYEEGDWTQLKKDLVTKLGRVEPERRYRKYSLIQFLNDTQDEGGIGTLSEYKTYIGEYETISTYLLRYKYIPQENMLHEDVFDCLSANIKGAISKEIINDNLMVRTEDGGYLIPPMRILNKYIEQELEARILVTKRLSSPRIKTVNNESITKEKNVKFKEELFLGIQGALKKMKELTKTLKEQQVVVNKEVPREKEVSRKFLEQMDELSKISQPQNIAYSNPQAEYSEFRLKENLPPTSSRYVPYAPAQNAPKPFVRRYYC
ncbi:hypothetical protein O181_008064 [Austropuccinia psidii MF-1]|uniref:Uncharacterized protein n=1 Tax=Austropuccinia psidii MF-1 TaxID=1389203 RepID=A0A9Q3BN64_9BASI|nr:hypothetical protein [Austropuccinia psidii MF-1]